MGLDMYLYKKTYVKNWDFMKPEDRTIITISGPRAVGIDIDKITSITEEVGYWRKANAIHQWFVDNVQNGVDDCGEHYVQSEQLKELVDICKTILAKVVINPEIAEDLLPTTAGFFFSGTDYDNWYLEGLKKTVEMLEPLVDAPFDSKTTKWVTDYMEGEFYYHSSW